MDIFHYLHITFNNTLMKYEQLAIISAKWKFCYLFIVL